MTIRVLHVLHELLPSGAETCLKVAGPLWAEQGISCDVLATGAQLGSFAGDLRDAGYRTGHLPIVPFGHFAGTFPRLLRQEGYDVVHTHVEGANFFIDLLAMYGGARVVQHVHNVFAFEGALRTERIVQRRLLRMLGVPFIGVSSDVVDNELTRFRNDARLLLNWVDLDVFHPPHADQRANSRESLDINDGVFALTTVANCNDAKNHDALLRALATLPDHIVWLHVGEGPTTPTEQELARTLGVAHRVRFLGRRDPIPALRAADAYLQPSINEGLSIAAIEAIAMRIPAVLSDAPGFRNLRAMDAAAVWVGTDPISIAEGIQRLVDGHRPSGTLDIEEAFSHRRAVPRLAAIYREVG